MAIKKITIGQFIGLAKSSLVFDVRSPGEYNHAKVPGAYSLPLFTDEERIVVGTAYKKQGRKQAIKIGLDYFGTKMKSMVEEVESVIKNAGYLRLEDKKPILVHCWRGGMRSAGVAWLLDLYGFEVYTLVGGYKAYRNWVLKQFEPDYDIRILGGYTGSGKTEQIHEMQKRGERAIDLEAVAGHQGSAFGGLGKPPQPTQEMFENLLAEELYKMDGLNFWLEDESQRIGRLNIPHTLWRTIRAKPVYFMDIPFEERLNHILAHYGKLEKEALINSALRIQKRLGPLETKTCIGYMVEDNYMEAFRILLKYYDKTYYRSLHAREETAKQINTISVPAVDKIFNTEKLLACLTINT